MKESRIHVRPGRPPEMGGQDAGRMIGDMSDDSAVFAGPPPVAAAASKRRLGDRAFRSLAMGSGGFIVLVIVLIGVFLVVQATPSLLADHTNFLLDPRFLTGDANNLMFGIRDLLLVTVLVALCALAIAMPVSLGIALFLTQYAPMRARRPLGYLVDLLAAVPSVVYGLWGILVIAPVLEPIEAWLNQVLGWFPLFAKGSVSISGGGTIFTAGVVLSAMLLPIITSVTREVFRQTPKIQIEGALALGATKWEMIRTTVLPFGRRGYVGASMLGLGRALGETVAVLMILHSSPKFSHFSLFDGGYTFASKIASAASEFSQPLPTGAFIAAGLVLFILTFVVNAIARWIAGRGAAR